jgi:hypothetical protein
VKIHRTGKRPLTLRRGDFVAAGGEGSVYARDGLAFKVFASPNAAPSPAKLGELAVLACDAVLAPIEVVRTASGEPIGYAMPLATDTVSLAQLTTRAFRQRVGFDDRDALALVAAMRDTLARIHAAGIVVVDLSATNVLVRRGRWTPCFIDTDSWQTATHDATAITPTIRDPLAHGPRFDPGSDWFAFAVVTFELLVGIHPFKGKHPDVRSFSERMRRGLSVLDPRVRIPPVCAPIDAIPPDLRAWYRDVFEARHRGPPPGIASAPAPFTAVARRVQTGLSITPVRDYAGAIRIAASIHGALVVVTTDALHIDARPLPCPAHTIALAHAEGRPIAIGRAHDDTITLDGHATTIVADELAHQRGHVFVRRGGDVLELIVRAPGSRPIAATRLVANAMPHASALYPGVLLQSVLGSTHATLLEGRACPQVRLPELDRLDIVDARQDGGVLIAIVCRDGAFDRFVFRFDDARAAYDCRVARGVAPIGAVLVTTRAGVCIARVDEGLEVFSARPGSVTVDTIGLDMPAESTLLEHEGAVLHVHGRTVERLVHPASRRAANA